MEMREQDTSGTQGGSGNGLEKKGIRRGGLLVTGQGLKVGD